MARTKQVARKSVVQIFPMPHHGINSDGPSSVQEKSASRKRSTDDGDASEDDDSDIDLGTAKRLRPTLPTFVDELQKENEALLVQVATFAGTYKELKEQNIALYCQLAEASDDNEMLRHQLDKAHNCLESVQSQIKATAPARERTKSEADAASVMAADIKRGMNKAIHDLKSRDWRKHEENANGDDISAALVPIVGRISVLSKLPQLESDSLAMDLLTRLVGRSYGDLATRAGHEYGDRPSDAAADGLFCTLARERRKRDPSWDFRPVLAQLKATAAGPAEYGINTVFTRSIAVMQGWWATKVIDLA
ncbi:hypothetical protein LTR10_012925 [Elasticomyces elasticus]|nr:hypothetical protein LTR10_012925 [Elasticomyces elasticus]KAK4978653.1 hypothetical protein LTR42_001153 [Elasticomyces elasticus]